MSSKVCQVKVLLIGDPGIGKTSLAKTITNGAFPSAGALTDTNITNSSQQTELDGQCAEYKCNKDTTITAGDERFTINIFDPSNDDATKDYLPQADICYLCFDVTNPRTVDSLQKKWLESLKLKRKIFLVGLKSDLAYDKSTCQQLESQGLQVITQEAGRCLAQRFKASHYVEVSALKYLGIDQLKDKTVFSFVDNNGAQCTKEKSRCSIM